MKNFLIYSVVVIAILMVFIVAGEYAVRTVQNPYWIKEHYMQEHASKIETIILGSSHSYNGINPDSLSSAAFNLGNNAQDFQYDYYLLTRYADKYHKLKNIILPVSYHSLYFPPTETYPAGGWESAAEYHIYMRHPYGSGKLKYNMEIFQIGRYHSHILAFLTKGDATEGCSPLGYRHQAPAGLSEEDMDSIVSKGLAFSKEIYSKKYYPYHRTYLEKICRFAKDNGLRLIVLTTPTYHTYYERVDAELLNKMYRTIDEIQQQYGVEYYNFFTDPRFSIGDFSDSSHLNDNGADKFTKIVDDIINRKTIQ